MSKTKTKTRRRNKVRVDPLGGRGTVPSSAPVIGKSVEDEIRVLGTELAKARENGDPKAICQFAETLANIKAKSAAMSCQMDATLRRILMAGAPIAPPPSGGSVTPISAVCDQLGADHQTADEHREEDDDGPEGDDSGSEASDDSEPLSEGDSDDGSDPPSDGEDEDGDV